MRYGIGQYLFHMVEFRAGKYQSGFGIIYNIGPFRRCQSPSHRNHNDARPRGSVKKAEIEIAILADPHNTVALLQTGVEQHCGDFGRGLFELRISLRSVLLHERWTRRFLVNPIAQEVIERQNIRGRVTHMQISPSQRACYWQRPQCVLSRDIGSMSIIPIMLQVTALNSREF